VRSHPDEEAGMKRRKLALIAVVALAAGGLSAGLAIASGGEEEAPLTGPALDQAVAAALERTGGGTVVETEVGDDGAAYGVEIRLDDGTVVEVSLDENFNVIGDEADDDGPLDDDGAGED
jgi:uncharacterized membrane protein YkoI